MGIFPFNTPIYTGAKNEIPTRMTLRRGILSALCIAVPPPWQMAEGEGNDPSLHGSKPCVLTDYTTPLDK